MEDKEVQNHAIFAAASVFIVTISGVLLLAFFYDFSNLNVFGLLFLIACFCCVLIAKNTYDVTMMSHLEDVPSSQAVADANQSMYRQLYQKSPVPYFVIDILGVVTSANTAAARLLGMQQNKMIGINIFDLLDTVNEEHKETLVTKFKGGLGVTDEMVKIKRTDHREVWSLLSLFQFENSSHQKQGLLTLVDITRQKKAEDAKSEFVSLASHQLRTPIAGMKWSAELLEMDSPDTLTEGQRRYMARLLESITRMARLVDDFLRVSRFELGNFTADYGPVDLPVLFQDVFRELDSTVKNKGLVIENNFAPEITAVMSDPNLLRMIITNLCSNAVKYTPPGGTVQLVYKEENGFLKFEVTDSGMGIPLSDQDQIFSKLFRATNAVRDVPDGTGLGLYIVREAVAVLRGKISFTSVEGRGTTFTVQFPFEPVED